VAGADYVELLTRAGAQVAGQVLGPIEVRTNLNAGEPVVIDPFAPGDGEPQQPSILMSILKPEVRVRLPNGDMVWSPAGSPSASYAPLVLAAAGAFLFTLVGVGGLVGKFAKPRTLLVAGGIGVAAIAALASQTKLEDPE
jgi:hypothetical protein